MTTFNPDLVLSTTIGKRAPGVEPHTFTVKLGDFPQAAIDKFLSYGFQRVFNDAVGGSNTPHADKIKAVADMIERFKQGQVGRVRGEAPDPFMVIVLRIVRKMVKAQDPAKYKAEMAGDKPDDYFKGVLSRIEAGKPDVFRAIMDEATEERKRQEAEAKGLAKLSVKIDL